MKIGLVCPYDIARGGGVQEHVLAQAAELKSRGYDVRILTPKPLTHNGHQQDDVIYVGSSAMLKTPISTSLELGINLARDAIDDVLTEENFDVLHIHEPEVPMLGAQIIAKAQCPVIATFHAMYPETPMAKTIEALRIPYSRSIFSKLDELTAVSDVAAEFVRARTGRKVHIIPNGIDLAKYTPAPPPQNEQKTILYVGRLEKRKGVRYLLAAYKVLQEQCPDVRLVIVGDGPERDRLEWYCENEGLKNVTFTGFVDDAEKLAWFEKADLFCSPAIYGESFGIVLLEAMARGVVTVAGNNPGYCAVMKDKGAISIVNPKDKTEFARRLELLLTDEELRDMWRAWAQEYVKQFSYENIVSQYEKLYQRLGKKRRKQKTNSKAA